MTQPFISVLGHSQTSNIKSNKNLVEKVFDGIFPSDKKPFDIGSGYNILVLLTPYDCPCYAYLLQGTFPADLKKGLISKTRFRSVYYLVSGDFSRLELHRYVGELENSAQVFIDSHNVLKDNLFQAFQTLYTPYIIITKNDSIIDHFIVDFQEDSLYQLLDKIQVP